MKQALSETSKQFVLERKDFPDLLMALKKRDYQTLGPTIHEGAIVYDELKSVEDLPIGMTDEQEGGTYRLQNRDDAALFGYVVGPHSWKKFLHPPKLLLWRARRNHSGFQMEAENTAPPRMAFIGVRACELQAIAVQDKVFINNQFVDAAYQSRRQNVFLVAVNCGQAGATCFCASMNAGPKATSGFDLALTEILENHRHYFVVEVGSELGAKILGEAPHREASVEEITAAEAIVARTAKNMGRHLDTSDIKELLYDNYEHPRWDDVAARCLTCTNCTMVCPTCFCTTVEDVTDLRGEVAERWRKWDSCFTMDFSYIHGGSVRTTPKARYRQWLTHKLATWQDQFGTSGCVGCGRCITWCPVGIDITKEVEAFRNEHSLEARTRDEI